MDISTLKSVFGPSPIEFLPAAQTAAEIAARNKMLVVGVVVIVAVTVVVTVAVHKKFLEQHPIKIVKKPVGIQEHYRAKYED